MGKPPIETFNKFKDKVYELSKKAGKKQYLVPYLMSSHPGSTLKDAVYLAEYLYKNHMRPEQVPVSYTHLDVYKRQDLRRPADHALL